MAWKLCLAYKLFCVMIVYSIFFVFFILLGMIQQDCLEGRFGWWRQLSGGNYYNSVLQFLQAEKTIRLRCLVKSGYQLKEIKGMFDVVESTKNLIVQEYAVEFSDNLSEFL